MILAVVGTRQLSPLAREYAAMIIDNEITSGRWDSYVTGDAPGVDTLLAVMCADRNLPCLTLTPQTRQWKPNGYMDRNILIVTTCDQLLCIRDMRSDTFGSGWTANYAHGQGKLYGRVEIS